MAPAMPWVAENGAEPSLTGDPGHSPTRGEPLALPGAIPPILQRSNAAPQQSL